MGEGGREGRREEGESMGGKEGESCSSRRRRSRRRRRSHGVGLPTRCCVCVSE
jgi:hypothetical protein